MSSSSKVRQRLTHTGSAMVNTAVLMILVTVILKFHCVVYYSCTGPGDWPGEGGCDRCHIALETDMDKGWQCLPEGSTCPRGTYYTLGDITDGSMVRNNPVS